MSRVLITGANGFIGKHCIKELINRGYDDIHAISSISRLDEKFYWHKCNLLDISEVNNTILKLKPDNIIHLAWDTEHGKYWNSELNLSWIQSSLQILKSFKAINGKSILLAGTCAEYDWNYGYCKEDITPINPNSLYGTSKNALNSIMNSFYKETNITSLWARYFFVYGPEENKYKLIPYIINSLLSGETAVCKTWKQIRDFIYVEDAARATIDLLEKAPSGSYNISSGTPTLLKEIANKIGIKLDKEELINISDYNNLDIFPFLLGDTSKIFNTISFSPLYSIDQGLDLSIKWWKENNYNYHN